MTAAHQQVEAISAELVGVAGLCRYPAPMAIMVTRYVNEIYCLLERLEPVAQE